MAPCCRIVCVECGRVISACACEGEKPTYYQLCRDCESGDTTIEPAAPERGDEESPE